MKMHRLRHAAISAALLASGLAYWWWQHTPTFLPTDPAAFVAQFPPPPAQGSAAARAELDELLAIQSARTPAQREAARADRKKDVAQFYEALGLDPATAGSVKLLRNFMEHVEDDVSLYVRAVKHRFARPRPYVVESRLTPCIDDVADNQSYPSGHASYGYVVALVLADMVPERRAELAARADVFAHHRMTCGVHYASDIAAGRRAAEWLRAHFEMSEEYRSARLEASGALRAALKLPPAAPR